jgi:hypothetical protein
LVFQGAVLSTAKIICKSQWANRTWLKRDEVKWKMKEGMCQKRRSKRLEGVYEEGNNGGGGDRGYVQEFGRERRIIADAVVSICINSLLEMTRGTDARVIWRSERSLVDEAE